MLKKRLLFVDDEIPMLEGLKRILRPKLDEWDCHFVDNPCAAFAEMEKTAIHVVVSDKEMPGMDGVVFLQQVFERYPDTVRLMLTGHTSLPTTVEAINRGHIFQLLLKPCETELLISALETALRQYHLQTAERELLRAQLEHGQQLASIGLMAAGIAHDLNNILGVITMQAHPDMLSEHPSPAARNTVLAQIYEEVQSAAELTRELTALSRREEDEAPFQTLDLRKVIESSATLLRPLLRKTVRFEVRQPSGPLPVLGHAGKLKQIIINLVINARDAVVGGGEIRLEAQPCQLAGLLPSDEASPQSGTYVCLIVSDTGHGMDEETRRRVFEPFFTTKEPGRGTGLGLSTVKSLVERHHGHLELESVVGVGTTFRVYLPRAHA